MKKLNKRKIRWVVREGDKRDMGFYTIAKLQDITSRHARRVHKKYEHVKDPILQPCGRKPKHVSEDERKLVIKTCKEYLVGATMLELILDEKGIHIPHNRIHRILLEEGLAHQEKNKQRKRRWVRYERKHSLSLKHTDWAEYAGWKFILYEDDASRFITGYGKFKHATSENAFKVLKRSLKHGKPKQLHSDHGSPFTSNDKEGCKKGESWYEQQVKQLGIQQIYARIKHPQSNGKMEKLVHTIKVLWAKTGSFEKAVKHYNHKRPHWSLKTPEGKLRTPHQAFLDKMRK
ncbi:DDE-type integrase/transposase/recombinase [Candidatus Woesearchaeota archaeon]|nr:DDE-type integrase/transposase/recombinase [Candidatus Woesearchaeota archaeon]